MQIQTTRLGNLDVSDEQIVQFPHGIPGFLNEKAFVLLPYEENSPFLFLQSALEPDLCFLIVDAFVFLKDYEFSLDDELANELGLSSESRPEVYLIATVKEKVTDMTVNLKAPVIINRNQGIGMQIILEKRDYPIRHRLFSETQPEQAPEGGR